MKVLIVFGSTTGNTESAAEQIKSEFGAAAETIDVCSVTQEQVNESDLLILGTSTWGVGDLQDDWINAPIITNFDLSNKKVALFGLGDQLSFSDSYVDGMGAIYDALASQNVTWIGNWNTDGYDYSASTAERDGKLVGLALDEENQGGQTAERISEWVCQLKKEMA